MLKPVHRLIAAASLLSLTFSACSQQNLQLPVRGQTGMVQNQSAAVRGQSTVRNGDWYAALPANLQQYYAGARGKTGRDLLLALNKIVSTGHKVLPYGPAKSYLYATADHITQGNVSGVFDSYSYVLVPGNGGDGNTYKEQGDQNQDGTPNDFINLEHTWPQSFFAKVEPMVSDMHHMFPTLSKPNAMRSNYPIGKVEGTVVYTTNGGAKLSALDKTGRHTPQATVQMFNLPWEKQPHQTIDNDFKVTFEPPDRQKGNTARALLYFYLRYFNQNIRQGAYDEVEFWDSKVPTFIQWAANDAPDELEIRRHESAAQQQRNRNPFIDIPNLAQLIGADVLINNSNGPSQAATGNARRVSSMSLTQPD